MNFNVDQELDQAERNLSKVNATQNLLAKVNSSSHQKRIRRQFAATDQTDGQYHHLAGIIKSKTKEEFADNKDISGIVFKGINISRVQAKEG